LAECLLPKQNVAGSNPVSRSTPSSIDPDVRARHDMTAWRMMPS
jgi:hypothetical protein